MDVRVRRLRKTEFLEIHKLIHKIFPKIDPKIEERDIIIVAEKDNELVGFSHAQIKNGKTFLRGIGVEKNHRGKEIGKKLLEKMLLIVSGFDFPIYLKVEYSNDVAINLYSKEGFVSRKYGDVLVMVRFPAN